MPTYTYESVPQAPGEEPVRFEMRQSMLDDALTAHPDTGVPVRRVITGGAGLIGVSKGGASQAQPGCGFQ